MSFNAASMSGAASLSCVSSTYTTAPPAKSSQHSSKGVTLGQSSPRSRSDRDA